MRGRGNPLRSVGRRAGWSLALLVAALPGCHGPAAPVIPEPADIVIVSGDGQESKAGWVLEEQFVVRVIGPDGLGIERALVRWRVDSGGGRFVDTAPTDPAPVPFADLRTDSTGIARVGFIPRVLGATTVTATAEGGSGGSAPSVSFTTEATVLVVEIGPNFWDWFDTTWVRGPGGGSHAIVSVGTPVEWSVAAEEARVTSTTVPTGGQGFDSGLLAFGGVFEFVPDVAGSWEYVDQVSGEVGTLTAVGEAGTGSASWTAARAEARVATRPP